MLRDDDNQSQKTPANVAGTLVLGSRGLRSQSLGS